MTHSNSEEKKNPIFGLHNYALCSGAILKLCDAFQKTFSLIKTSLLSPYCVSHMYFPLPSEQ